MTCLDLFITSDTAVAHLAGALGVPVWMALSSTPDWRWLSKRDDNPWGPTMRIFRQQKFMVWAPVFDRIAIELRKLVPTTAPTRSVAIETAPGELIDKITILEIKTERFSDQRGRRLCSARSDTVRGNWAHDASIKLRRIAQFSAEPRTCRLVRVSSGGIRSTEEGAEQCNKHFSPWLLLGRSVSCQIPASSGLNSARPDKFAQRVSF
jgi:hypothetical protein